MDHLAAVGDPELREALLFARSHARPVTADELAAGQGVAPERRPLPAGAARRGAGCSRSGTSGAPALRPGRRPAREDLLGRPTARVDRVPRSERVRSRGCSWTRSSPAAAKSRSAKSASSSGASSAGPRRLRPAKSLETGFERVCAAVRRLGYQASLEHADEHGSRDCDAHVPAPPARARAPGGRRDRPRDVGRARELRAGGRRGRAGSLRDAGLLRRPRVVQGRARAHQTLSF